MFLLHLNWAVITGEPTKDEAITQSFVASAATGNRQVCVGAQDVWAVWASMMCALCGHP